jgi:hypothetical protein
MYKALAAVDSIVRLPSGQLAVVTKHLPDDYGQVVEVEYLNGGGRLNIHVKLLRPSTAPLNPALKKWSGT